MNQTTLSLRLSTEELVFILWLLNTPALPGMGGNPFGSASEEQIAAALSSAERSLRARRLVSKSEDGKIQMDEVVMALVGTCAVPEFSLVLTSESPEAGRLVHYFHATQFMAVEHSNPEPGIHVFEALEDKKAIAKRIEAMLQLDKQAVPKAKPFETTLDVLQRATQAAMENSGQSLEILVAAGIDKSIAREFNQTLTQVRRRSALAAIHNLRSDSPTSNGFVLLEGNKGIWAMQIMEDDSSAKVQIWPCSISKAQEQIDSLISGKELCFA